MLFPRLIVGFDEFIEVHAGVLKV